MAWALDLDGVLWRGEEEIAGSVEAVGRLRAAGEDVVFVTNNASVSVAEVVGRLTGMGIEAAPVDVVVSAEVTAATLPPGSRALVLGMPPLRDALTRRGVIVVEPPDRDIDVSTDLRLLDLDVDAVVVGWSRHLRWVDIAAAHVAITRGASLVATNADACYPSRGGTLPGNGAMVAALVTSTGVEPTVVGKPYPPMAHALVERAGPTGIVVGDQPATDGRLAEVAGWRFALVCSGVTSARDARSVQVDPAPDFVTDDLAALVELVVDPGE